MHGPVVRDCDCIVSAATTLLVQPTVMYVCSVTWVYISTHTLALWLCVDVLECTLYQTTCISLCTLMFLNFDWCLVRLSALIIKMCQRCLLFASANGDILVKYSCFLSQIIIWKQNKWCFIYIAVYTVSDVIPLRHSCCVVLCPGFISTVKMCL